MILKIPTKMVIDHVKFADSKEETLASIIEIPDSSQESFANIGAGVNEGGADKKENPTIRLDLRN